MKLLPLKEHRRCINYDHGKNPIIELVSIKKDESWENLPLGDKLIFLLKGKLSLSFDRYINCPIECKQIIYLPTGHQLTCKSLEDSTFFVMSIQGHTHFCEGLDFKDLENYSFEEERFFNPLNNDTSPITLEINNAMEQYLLNLLNYVQVGLKCQVFYIMKIKELFYIFRWFYSEDALVMFFQYALKGSSEFAATIMKSWYKYRSVGELADAMNYTVSGFEKRFKRVFGISPYKWMINQRAKLIFNQVRTTDLTFKQISAEFGFSSLSSFNDFCKTNLGKSPGEIRSYQKNLHDWRK